MLGWHMKSFETSGRQAKKSWCALRLPFKLSGAGAAPTVMAAADLSQLAKLRCNRALPKSRRAPDRADFTSSEDGSSYGRVCDGSTRSVRSALVGRLHRCLQPAVYMIPRMEPWLHAQMCRIIVVHSGTAHACPCTCVCGACVRMALVGWQ